MHRLAQVRAGLLTQRSIRVGDEIIEVDGACVIDSPDSHLNNILLSGSAMIYFRFILCVCVFERLRVSVENFRVCIAHAFADDAFNQ